MSNFFIVTTLGEDLYFKKFLDNPVLQSFHLYETRVPENKYLMEKNQPKKINRQWWSPWHIYQHICPNNNRDPIETI